MSKKVDLTSLNDMDLEYLKNNGKFEEQLTDAEKKQIRKDQKEIEKLSKDEEGFAI